LSYRELNLLKITADQLWSTGNAALPNVVYDSVVNLLDSSRKNALSAISKQPYDCWEFSLEELADIKKLCDAAYKQGTLLIQNAVYDTIIFEIQKRQKLQNGWSTSGLANGFSCANMSKGEAMDLLNYLDDMWSVGKASATTEHYELVRQEVKLRNLYSLPNSPAFEVKFPSHWSFPSSVGVDIIELKPSSKEFVTLATRFRASLPTAQIYSIKRVQNYGMYRLFYLTTQRLKAIRGINETVMLYHGCPTQPGVDVITQYGFRQRYCPSGAIGDGVYFAINSSYSNSPPYILQHADGSKQMFIAQIFVGNPTQNHYGPTPPPPNFDSVTDHANMYCVYDHFQAYPEYIIHYRV